MNESVIQRALDIAGLEPRLVLGKTRELYRLLQMKMPSGCLKKAEPCRHIIAIELSCRVLRIPFDKSKLVSQAFVNQAIYQEALISCKNVLNLQWEAGSAIDILSVNYGAQLKGQANIYLETYRKMYIDKLDKNRQAHIDLNAPAYQAAAFILAAKTRKVRIDKASKIAHILEVDAAFLRTVVDSMTRVILGENGANPDPNQASGGDTIENPTLNKTVDGDAAVGARKLKKSADDDDGELNEEENSRRKTKTRKLSIETQEEKETSRGIETSQSQQYQLVRVGGAAGKVSTHTQVQPQTSTGKKANQPVGDKTPVLQQQSTTATTKKIVLKPEQIRMKRLQALGLSSSGTGTTGDMSSLKENISANTNTVARPSALDKLKPTVKTNNPAVEATVTVMDMAVSLPVSTSTSVVVTNRDDGNKNAGEKKEEKNLTSRELYALWKQKKKTAVVTAT